ncbi:TIGR00153 family protein [archaeon]|nr:TIGR00153 family protein [archaeon]
MRNIIGMFAKSPFGPLEEHMLKVMQCSELFSECIKAYCKEDFKESERLAMEVSRVEHEADKIKNQIRENLPKSIFMPVDRGDFLDYLREQDQVSDSLEDSALSLTLRRTKVPEDIKKDLMDLSLKVIDVVNILPLAVKSLNDLLETSFAKKQDSRIGEYLNLLGEKEQLTDELELKLEKSMHEKEERFTKGEFYHIMRTVKHIARIADHAENCGDRIRLMIAKQ